MDPLVQLFVILLIIYATSWHELAHAYVATWRGDPTPGRHGRLTFNPLPHLQPVMTAIVMPIFMYMSGGGLFCLATTPINPSRFRRPLLDHALVAAAGPLMNFIFAALLVGLLWIPGIWQPAKPTYIMEVCRHASFWNLIIGAFNLMPLPPLDGYWICRGLLPLPLRRQADAYAHMGTIPLIVVIVFGGMLFAQTMLPYIAALHRLITPAYPSLRF